MAVMVLKHFNFKSKNILKWVATKYCTGVWTVTIGWIFTNAQSTDIYVFSNSEGVKSKV
jgi:hypothetical protein